MQSPEEAPMLCSLCAVALLSIPATADAIEPSEVYGTWKLVSSVTRFIDSGEERNTLGSKPVGYITYSPDGRMMTVAVSNERPNVEKATNLTDADRAKLFRTMWAYAGTFTLNGNAITHHVDASWNEFWSGQDFIRDIVARDGRLIYTTKPQMSVQEGKMEVLTIVWEKVR
ncbi:lipocalin-like domain-containing protein [Methylobacterium sp. E-041]|uniref:lipocalin-like domain-containing protein n=1 Tax=Methylobacterium sp. E-041 TaxID=2836573 RepID=UPI001FB8CABC|nr:lipocalin-like domain-containing protein [Methylobacterium sp. E-041]MCJ2104985.1 lipocalin-like domain-containing protein [Methylobacterium sp. E-041]